MIEVEETLQKVLHELRTKQATLAVAESCTGGLISTLLTDIPGCSSVFRGAVVVYHADTKTQLLQVAQELIERDGVVSSSVAIAMAEGVRTNLGASYGISTTGVAGPGGGTESTPVGTVWCGFSGSKGAYARRLMLDGDRRKIRQQAANAVFEEVLELLRKN